MKLVFFFLFLISSSCLLWAQEKPALFSTLEEMSTKLLQFQQLDGRIEGTFEADPGFEMLSLVLMKKFGERDRDIEKLFIDKLVDWKTEEGFGNYPRGPYCHDVTGLVLLSLEDLGYDLTDLGLKKVKENFVAHGGTEKLNLGTKILLVPLMMDQSKQLTNIIKGTLIRFPDSLPMSQKSFGVFRSMMIPFATWNFYHKHNEKKKGLKNTKNSETAFKGVEWILNHQMENGSWYTLIHATVNIAALAEAQKAGVGQYQDAISKGLSAIRNWRTKNFRGDIAQQLTLTGGWDTSQSIMALAELPSTMKTNFSQKISKSVDFLDQNQITEKGDWAIHSPDLVPGGWSFIIENKDYPDTDVAAAVLEAKYAFPQFSKGDTFDRGLEWLLGLQNKDGGFPAWEKGVSKTTNRLMKLFMPELPEFSDISQADVTARITRLLYKLSVDQKMSHRQKILETAIQKSCRFIQKSQIKKEPFWKGRWLIAYLYGTSEAVDTLLTTGCSDLDQMEKSVAWIYSKQNTDGGFGEDHSSLIVEKFVPMNSTVMQTSYIVQSLITYEEHYKTKFGYYSPLKVKLDQAMGYLLSKVREGDGLIKERSFTGVMGAKLWYADYALSPQFMSLRAISRYYRL